MKILNKIKKRLNKTYWNFISFYFFRKLKPDFHEQVKKNREILTDLGILIDENEYELNDYGIPYKNFQFINQPINKYLCNIDLITILLTLFKKKEVNYLEIGVSIMKNFFVVENNFKNFNLFAYDINKIIGKHKNKFQKDSVVKNLFFSENTNNSLFYYVGDVLNEFQTMEFSSNINSKFDFIYSDALHTQEGVEAEFKNLIQNNLNHEFIIYYDDLDIDWDIPTVEDAVFNIFRKLKKVDKNVKLFTFWINGWLGQYESMHKNAIITNIDLENYLRTKKLKLPFFRKYL
jgi:hypothetical protein